MSRIIKEGNVPTRVMKCTACDCKFEYSERDVSRIYHPNGYNIDTDVREAYNNYVFCPCCDRQIMILPQMPGEGAENSDFMDDVRALAKQYGYELVSVEVK